MPAVEPSERATESTDLPSRPRELLISTPAPGLGKYQRMAMFGGGSSLALSGLGLLTYNHLDLIVPLLPDAMGTVLMASGSALMAYVVRADAATRTGGGSARQASDADGTGWNIEVVPLNDDYRYAEAADAITAAASAAAGSGDGPGKESLLGEAETLLKEAETAAEPALRTARKAATHALLDSVRADLDSGLSPRRIRQKLTPRLFVIDFDTRAPPSRGVAPAPAPTTRALLDELREQVSFLLTVATPFDEVLLRVTSPGGAVTDYGLAAAQFARLVRGPASTPSAPLPRPSLLPPLPLPIRLPCPPSPAPRPVCAHALADLRYYLADLADLADLAALALADLRPPGACGAVLRAGRRRRV